MHPRSSLFLTGATVCIVMAACGPQRVATTAADPAHDHDAMLHDSAFAGLQQRGQLAMGVDQYTSTHVFDALPDGGRIELQRAVQDTAGVEEIRNHLREIAAAFQRGDFAVPGFVHAGEVPGTRIMASRRDRISYTFRPLPAGGEVLISTTDPQALEAIRAFMQFQREQHRSGGRAR